MVERESVQKHISQTQLYTMISELLFKNIHLATFVMCTMFQHMLYTHDEKYNDNVSKTKQDKN